MLGGEKCQSRETDEKEGWIREKLRKGRTEEERGRGYEEKDKRRPAL